MMPTLSTRRLVVRPFITEDLDDVYRLFDVELADANFGMGNRGSLASRSEWLRWTVLNYEQLANLHQPPYGDRAVVLSSTAELVGSCGFVPCLNAFKQLPSLSGGDPLEGPGRYSTEFGLFYATFPAHQRKGYATEAAQAMINYAFGKLQLSRIVATTEFENTGSIAVMRKLGMRIERNPLAEPPWLQVVGILENRRSA
ncbi:MAG TPA: GNAT family N-acetyltransferase [Candidatus Tectomicrobia bacterium]